MKVLEIISTIGPGRRADVTVVEMVLLAEGTEASEFDLMAQQLQEQLPARLSTLGLRLDDAAWEAIADCDSAISSLAATVSSIALALQNAAGHDLYFHDFLQDADPHNGEQRYRFIFQHDDAPGGEQAGDLAMCILADVCPRLNWQALLHDANQPLATHVANYIESAREFVTPPETLGLIAAAQARQIPVMRLEREPYGALRASFRVAPNGMVMLGHSCHRLVLDGLYCVDRPGLGFNIMQNRKAMWSLLAKLGVACPLDEQAQTPVISASRARRAARRVGFPLRARPLQRHPAGRKGWLLEDEVALERFLSGQDISAAPCLFEPELSGSQLEVLIAGGQVLTSRRDNLPCEVPAAIELQCMRIDRALGCGLLLIRLQQLQQQGDLVWVVADLDPSPPLARWLAGEPELLAAAYNKLLDWLFPPGSPCRVPIVSVTGTNGKTTTSTLISRLAEAEGRFVGIARTTGVALGQETKRVGDHSGFLGHCMVLEDRQVDFAVLETARGDVLRSGFAFDHSDVAICCNVTAEHLGEHGIETVEDMAVIKRLVLMRSRNAIALNADDPLCLGMLPWLGGRSICLTSLQRKPEELRALVKTHVKIVYLDLWQAEDWIMFDDQGKRTPIIPVNDIPATFNGLASHNVSNIMHAVAAAMALGFRLENIRKTLAVFAMGFEVLPGRLNMHHNGRIQIIMDNAHNADGLAQLAKFTDRLPCSGRRILRFGVSTKASVAAAFRAGSAAAGHFDHYICSDLPRNTPTDSSHLTEGLKQGLLANGVAPESIEVFTDPERSVEYPVSLCQPGDLLVLVTSTATLASTWQKILNT